MNPRYRLQSPEHYGLWDRKWVVVKLQAVVANAMLEPIRFQSSLKRRQRRAKRSKLQHRRGLLLKRFLDMPAACLVRKRFKPHVEENIDADDDLIEWDTIADRTNPSAR